MTVHDGYKKPISDKSFLENAIARSPNDMHQLIVAVAFPEKDLRKIRFLPNEVTLENLQAGKAPWLSQKKQLK